MTQERIISITSPVINGTQPLVVLTSDGRIFKLSPKPRDFATTPGHKPGVVWEELDLPEQLHAVEGAAGKK